MKKDNREEQPIIISVNEMIQGTLFDKRIIMLYDEVSMELAEKVTKKLLVLDSINNNPIILRINSPGGCCTAGYDIIATMRLLKSPVHTFISGEACSMAALISVCGDKRYMTSNSTWMAHPAAGGGGHDYLSFKKDRIKFHDMLNKQSDDILSKHTKLTKKEIHKQNHGELWLTANECKRKGIIDIIKQV